MASGQQECTIMVACYVPARHRQGWSVCNVATGVVASLGGILLVGLMKAEAEDFAALLNRTPRH
jgi:hypothetical protein